MAQPSATRREAVVHRSAYGFGSPLLYRAHISMRGPADTRPTVPSVMIASSASVRGERPASTVAMITGHASRVDAKRASTLFDGINRSWYDTAPSMKTSVFSPGLRARRPTSALLQSIRLVSGRCSSATSRAVRSATFVFTSFALRGAPCGDDSRLWATFRRYHEQEGPKHGGPDDPGALLLVRMRIIGTPPSEVRIGDSLRFFERHPVQRQIGTRLSPIPRVPRHRRTVATLPYLGLTWRSPRRYSRPTRLGRADCPEPR